MSAMLFNIFSFLRERVASATPYVMSEGLESGFPVHPSASELAESLLVDPDALKNETYEPGIYDESGDYYPQYSDDPSKMPDYIAPNDLGETALESSPVSDSQYSESVSSETDSKSE